MIQFVVDLSKQDQNDDEEETDYTELSQETIPFIYKSPVTSLAVSNDSVVAVGTSAGAIQLLYGGLTSDKPQGLLKWHIDQVRALQFTPTIIIYCLVVWRRCEFSGN